MAKQRKSWAQKLEEARAKTVEPRKVHCEKTGQWLLIPPVAEIEDLMRRNRPGRLMTMKQVTDLFAERHQVDFCCPMTTGIFAWIIAHAAEEQPEQKDRPPWWRIVKAGGELNPKYPGGGDIQRERLEAEGHRVVAKGKRLVVEDYERALVDRMLPKVRPKTVRADGFERKVLHRDDFGLCVLLPKTEWTRLPERGAARVLVDGTPCCVTVCVEACDCRGESPHQHRFLSLPDVSGLELGSRVMIGFASSE